jgi:hypothetical protein
MHIALRLIQATLDLKVNARESAAQEIHAELTITLDIP